MGFSRFSFAFPRARVTDVNGKPRRSVNCPLSQPTVSIAPGRGCGVDRGRAGVLVYTVVRRGLFLFSWLFPRESLFWGGQCGQPPPSAQACPLFLRPLVPRVLPAGQVCRICSSQKPGCGPRSAGSLAQQTHWSLPHIGLSASELRGTSTVPAAKSRSLISAGASEPVIWPTLDPPGRAWQHRQSPQDLSGGPRAAAGPS